MSRPSSIVLCGVGGYGNCYMEALRDGFSPEAITVAGAVDPLADTGALKKRGIPCFPTLEAFYDQGLQADLAVIASPIQFHLSQSKTALTNKSRVLCEKPLCATIEEARDLIRARDDAGGWVMIGYQWSYSTAIQTLKKEILAKTFGKPIRAKALCLWPRDRAYYLRNDWAGRKRDPSGRWVLDSPANNAMAHFIHNLFYLLGDEVHLSALPLEVTAEHYRAYPIENFDTVAFRSRTGSGTEVLFYASHVTRESKGPLFAMEFEKGTLAFETTIEARMADGIARDYGSPEDTDQFQKLRYAVEALENPKPMLCGLEAAFAQTLCVKGIHDSLPETAPFPASMIRDSGEGTRTWVEGLDEILLDCYNNDSLPRERGVSWARTGASVDLAGYRLFMEGG